MSNERLSASATSDLGPALWEAPPHHPEWVVRGLFSAFLAVVAGTVLTVALWQAGYIASISGFVMAAGAVFLYTRAAGGAPRHGLVPLVLLIIAGMSVSFMAVVVSDLWQVYNQLDDQLFMTRSRFIMDNAFRGDVLAAYGKDMVMFAVFGALGVFGTLVRLLRSER